MILNHNVYSETPFVVICIMAANIVGLVGYGLIERHRPGKGGVNAKMERHLVVLAAKSPPRRYSP
jgi:hypothetical protein